MRAGRLDGGGKPGSKAKGPAESVLSLPCREVFARGHRPLEVIGPLLEDEAAKGHEGFWRPI